MSVALYNECDPFAAQWLRNLIDAGHIAPGVVDERSIVELDPEELRAYTQVHLFAGIAGWSHALRLAGWPDERPVWTGSCPCQPFSSAGARRGARDERHLWPSMLRLIQTCRPPVVFGEQVATSITNGWLEEVSDGLEQSGYILGASDLCATSVNQEHARQRVYWAASNTDRHRKPNSPIHAEASGMSETHTETEGRGEGFGRLVQGGDGFPARVGRLRAYGNAIVPQVAAEFITAFTETHGHA